MKDVRSDIVEAALSILDAYGLADLSMRRVADAVGMQAASLYWHVPNKQALLAAIADEILRRQSPSNDLAGWARSLRRVLLAHRDGAELVSAALAVDLVDQDPMDRVQQLLESDGWANDHQRQAAANTWVNFVMGHVIAEQSRSQLLELGVLNSGIGRDDEGFEVGLNILLKGTESIHRERLA